MTATTLIASAFILSLTGLPAGSPALTADGEGPAEGQAVQSPLATGQDQDDPAGEVKIFDDLVIPEGEVRSGAVRVIGGNLSVAGRVTGRITVLGGDVELLPTAVIEGTIATIGGRIHRSPEAKVTGQVLEINRGKVSLSREESREIFGSRERSDKLLDRRDDEDEDWQARRVNHQDAPDWRLRGRRPSRQDFEVFPEATIRYNRAEGLALYVPFHPDTDDIPGFKVYGYAGRSFGAGKWYGRLGVGEYIWRGRIGLLVEGHSEPRNDDGWRVSPHENSLSALLINRDWYDWYEAEGYGGSFVLSLPSWMEFRARYRDEVHREMDVVTHWSLFGGDRKFRPKFGIDEGRDVNVQYRVSVGRPVGLSPGRYRGNAVYTYTQTMPGSEFDYTREDFSLEAFIPLHRRLGIRLDARTGTIAGDSYGLQHQVAVGGIGSLQGFTYKDLNSDGANDTGNHYGVVSTTFSLRDHHRYYSVIAQLGRVWDSTEPLLAGQHISDLLEKPSAAVGLGLGDEDTRLEFFKPLTGAGDWVVYFRIFGS